MSALKRMVARLDGRNKRTSAGFVTTTAELAKILPELSKLVSVSVIEKERYPYPVANEIDIEIKFSLTLERDKL